MVEFNIVSVDMSVISDGPEDPSVRSFVADDCVISLVGVVVGAEVGVEVCDVTGVVVGNLVGAVVRVVVGAVVGVVVGVVVVVMVGDVVVMVGIFVVLVFIGPGDPSVNSVVVDVPLISLVDVADVMVLRCVCIVVIIIVTVSIKVENPSIVVVWVE